MKKKFNFSRRHQEISFWTILSIVLFVSVIGITLAFFASSDFASSHVGMSGKVLIEAVGSGNKSIEDTLNSCNLEIKLQDDYEVLIPGMEIEVIANCKVHKSTTKPLLRAKLDVDLTDNLTGEMPSDEMNIVSDIYSQLIEKIEDENNWYLHIDSYFYYIGDENQTADDKGDYILKEIDATANDTIVTFMPDSIIFPTFVDKTYSGLGIKFKITFQAIQNYIPDDDGKQLLNTINNSQKIFDEFADDDLLPPASLDYFITSINADGDVVLDIKEGAVLPETLVLPSYDAVGRKITVIGDSFASNTTIKNLVVPSSYTSIESSAFENNKTIEYVDLSRTQITEIPQKAFYKSSIVKVILPDTVKTLGTSSFSNSSLSSIILPQGLEKLNNYALHITRLTSIYIPKTVTSMGALPIYSSQLRKIIVDNENPKFEDEDNQILYSKGKKQLIMIASLASITNYIMPNSVTSVSQYSMTYASNIQTITFNENNFTIPGLLYNVSLKWIEFKTLTVPPINNDGLFGAATKNVKIYVPDGALSSYKTTLSEYASNIYPVSQRP